MLEADEVLPGMRAGDRKKKMIYRQMTLFDILPGEMQPKWVDCFKTCIHFEAHKDYPPDLFPGTRTKRCSYCDHEGTSGEQFRLEEIAGSVEMFCKYYDRGM